eukprot:1194287-Prorocentrum_minimum.AAC.3
MYVHTNVPPIVLSLHIQGTTEWRVVPRAPSENRSKPFQGGDGGSLVWIHADRRYSEDRWYGSMLTVDTASLTGPR